MGTGSGLCVCVFLLCLSAINSLDEQLQYRQKVDLEEGLSVRKPKDIEYKCPTPQAPPNSYITGDNYEIGGVITVHCNDGYVLHGNKEVRCVPVPDPFHHRVIWDNIVGHNPECVKESIGHDIAERLTDDEDVEPPPVLVTMGPEKKSEDEHIVFPKEPTVPSPKNLCSLKSDPGRCKARMLRYYYDSESKKCLTFYYGGCQGNQNRFKTEDECKKKCMSSSE